ncbi:MULTISPECIES: methyl-accepting chemotaxis protein [Clostridium]|uniref:methyl-accepting chemotaxis protein n=1 Tax=Clostridium TaxID=1485 RepID=UPI000824383A|nr:MULTISPECIES: methyl-accepting chemotaxis protein [Clostridium]PJI07786.1 methyl-accepting chemotaxis protein [Clostridium sp. CT7]
MKKVQSTSIKMKILVIPMILMFISIAIIASVSIVIAKNSVMSQMESDGVNLANRISKDVENNSTATDNLNKSIEDRIRTLANFIIANKAGVNNDYLRNLAKQFEVDEINVSDPTGKVTASNIDSNMASPFTSQNASYAILEGKTDQVMEAIRKSTDNGNYYKYGAVKDPSGGFVQVGIVANKVQKLTDSMKVQTLINELTKAKSIEYALYVNKDLKVLADSDKKEIGTTLKDNSTVTAVKNKKTYCSKYKYNGRDVYDIMVPVYSNGNFVGSVDVGISMQNMYKTVYKTMFIIIIVAIILFILLGLLLLKISKGITDPLNELVDVSKKIADGELDNDIDIDTEDEIGVLATAFKNMSEHLKDTIRNIKNGTENVNSMSSELSSNSDDMKNAADGVAKAIQEVAEGATEQSNDLINISSTVSKLAKELDDMHESLLKVNESSSFTETKTKEGQEKIGALLESINEVKNLFDVVVNKIQTLDSSVSKVGEITQAIDEISEQTNLLALNAAVEAARAGEAGKGFSVVAEEVGKLAEQSKESTEEINKLIGNITVETKNVIMTSSNVKKAFSDQSDIIENTKQSYEDMLSAIRNIAPLIKNSYGSVEIIMKSKDDILNKVDSLTAVSEETSATSEEISASSEELYASSENVSSFADKLNKVAKGLDDSVNKFKL